jgi:hypothetical protein
MGNLMRQSHLIKAMCLLLSGSMLSPFAIASVSQKQSKVNQAKEYAFASCIFEKYKGDSLSSEADAWASGIVENGSLDIQAYTEISELSKKSPSTGTTRLGVAMRLQSCFNYIELPRVR